MWLFGRAGTRAHGADGSPVRSRTDAAVRRNSRRSCRWRIFRGLGASIICRRCGRHRLLAGCCAWRSYLTTRAAGPRARCPLDAPPLPAPPPCVRAGCDAHVRRATSNKESFFVAMIHSLRLGRPNPQVRYGSQQVRAYAEICAGARLTPGGQGNFRIAGTPSRMAG